MSRLRGGDMSRLPGDVCSIILTRLPVKSILACKCVSKTWLDLISRLVSASDFVQMHLDYHRQNSSRLMFTRFQHDYTALIYSVGYDSLSSSLLPQIGNYNEIEEFNDGYVAQIDYPLKDLDLTVDLFGSCNGIVCLWFHDDYRYDREEFFCLWNPETKEYKRISEAPERYAYSDFKLYALVYDPAADVYKFMIAVDLFSEERTSDIKSLVHVYTSGSDSWKSFLTPHYFDNYHKSGMLFKGDLHWLSRNYIVSLDIANEEFKEIQPPLKPLNILLLGVLEDRLCVITEDYKSDNAIEIWEMQVYRDANSWTKCYTITNRMITRNFVFHVSDLRFMWYFEAGVILLVNSCGLVLYEPEHGRAIQQYVWTVGSAENYSESLVSLNSGTYDSGSTTNSAYTKLQKEAERGKKNEEEEEETAITTKKKGQKRTTNHQYNTRQASKAARESTSFEDESFTAQRIAEKERSKTNSTSKDSYQTWTVKMLRALLKERGLMVKGNKDELIARLRGE